MPEQTQNITNIPAPRVPFIDPRTNLISREWYRFFLNLFTLTGSGQSGSNTVVTTTEQQLGPMFTDLSGDFEQVYSQGQIISMMSAFESNCAEIAQELHTLPFTQLGTLSSVNENNVRFLGFDTTPQPQPEMVPGTLVWNDTDGTLDLVLKGGNVTLQIGQESVQRSYNDDAAGLVDGNIVYVSGAQGNRVAVKLAKANAKATSSGTLGIATEHINHHQSGFITTFGLVRDINTAVDSEGHTLADGDILYLSATVAGGFTKVLPVAPNFTVSVGYVVRAHASVGSIFVNVNVIPDLNDLNDVDIIGTPADGSLLTYNASSGLWENHLLDAGTNITITELNGIITIDATGGGSLTNWTEGVNTSAPNATVPAVYFTPNNAATNVDAVINPKGTGALLAQVPDSTSAGGDKRGTNAVDLQTSRYDATCVASGNYATIVGGYGNVAANDYAFVGGGDSNTAIGIRSVIAGGVGNVVNGDFSVIGGGYYNSIPGVESAFIGGGNGNAASGVGSTVAGGESNGATVKYCFVGGGYKNSANGEYSAIVGGKEGNARGLYGAEVFSAGGFSGTVGSAQRGIYVARVISSNATPIAITFDGNAISTTNQVVLSNNSTFFFKISLVARRADAADESAAYTIEGVIDRQASAATTAFVGTPVKTIFAEDNTAWDVSVSADTTNGALTITVTGETGKTIRWVAKIETVEVTN